ncbi:MAG: pyridoxal-phosphate dependent enzyme [Candidatus Latescibacteria bacterium]|nr:pyridoxal-phosphate dependent enzyme [Candidatus Latescibacterota bacterium]
MTDSLYPQLAAIEQARQQLAPYILQTPVSRLAAEAIAPQLDPDTQVWLKLELFQRTGTFKPRGALNRMLALDAEQLPRGVTAVSAGNHAIAVGYAAAALGTSAKVVMPKNTNPARLALCRDLGAQVVLVDDVHAAFDMVRTIEAEEGRIFVHPFEGPLIVAGTGTVGLELMEQCPDLDAVVVPIGGGGLCAGVAAAVKQRAPACQVFGVEPVGANTMQQSFQSGQPESLDRVATIADSLGAPHTAAYSLGVCRRFVDELVQVDDDALCAALYFLFARAKLAVEPAGAATTAALLGPLRQKLAGRRVGLVVCGANIDSDSFVQYLQRGKAQWAA